MDPAGLLISITTIAYTLDALCGAYNSASNTLALIKAQIKILETGIERIQEWLHYTDPTSRTLVQQSLQDAVATVNDSLQRLNEDLETVVRTGPKTAKMLGRSGSDQWVKTKFVYNEGRMRKHLTDVRECASLMHFTLNVCQLPSGNKDAQQEARELEVGARKLHRAQTTSGRAARRVAIQESNSEQTEDHSDNYTAFLKQIMDAEAELPDDSPTASRQDSLQSSSSSVYYEPSLGIEGSVTSEPESEEREALHLPESPSDSKASTATARATSQPSTPVVTSPQPLSPTSLDTPMQENTPPPGSGDLGPSKPPKEPVDAKAIGTPPSPTAVLPVYPVQVKRKPVNRASIPSRPPGTDDLPVYSQEPQQGPRGSRSASSPAASQPPSIIDKVTPLTESLRSLNTTEYLQVELDQVPVPPYSDNPPSYAVSSSSIPDGLSFQRVDSLSPSTLDGPSLHIIRLVHENRRDELKAWLSSGGNVNEVDSKTGRTAIMEASRLRRWEIHRSLLQSGARVHLKDTEGNTALHLAAAEGDADICQSLLIAGSHTEDCNGDGKTPLELGVGSGQSEAVLCLLNNLFSRPKKNDEIILRAFLETVKRGDVLSAQAFIAREVKPKKIKEPWRPLAYAVQSGSLPMLELMLNQKCSLKEKSPAGWTPLHFAANHGHQHIMERLLALKVPWKAQTKKTEQTALHLAAVAGHTSAALALVSHKDANVTVRDVDHQEPIHHAFRNGDIKLATGLMDGGAKPQNVNRFGWKPIHVAAAYGHATLVAEFLTRGVSISDKLSSPSMKPEKRTNDAARHGYWAEIRWPHPGARPLHLALEFGHNDVVKMLISGGAKLEESDTHGWRPLHYAAFNCRPEMVELLLQRGADPEAKTDDGNTAIALGFREHGLDITKEQRDRVVDLLQVAMTTHKLKVKELIKLSSPSKSKVVAKRNLAWHKAQLADALYQTRSGNEGEDDESTEDADESDLSRVTTEQQDNDAYEPRSSLQITKQ